MNLGIPTCNECEGDRYLNVTIANVEWLMWAGIGLTLVEVALVGVAFYHTEWALWAWALALSLAGIVLMDIAIWILVIAKSRLEGVSGGPRKVESEDNAHSALNNTDL